MLSNCKGVQRLILFSHFLYKYKKVTASFFLFVFITLLHVELGCTAIFISPLLQQYQSAIRTHKAGKAVNFDELPVPPGEFVFPVCDATLVS